MNYLNLSCFNFKIPWVGTGADCVKVILDAVTSGSIDIQAIHHIAAGLDSGDERVVSGKSLHRTKSVDSCKPDQEMRQVLNDWYNQELYGLEWCDALDKLIKIFESDVVNLRPVAKDLKVIRTKKIQGSKANQTPPTPDVPDSSAGESALRSTSHLEHHHQRLPWGKTRRRARIQTRF